MSKLPNSKILEIAKPHQNDHGFVYADCVIGFAHDIEAELSRLQADQIIRAVAELPDRNSPEGWPEAMLVTADELRQILLDAELSRQETEEELRARFEKRYGSELALLLPVIKEEYFGVFKAGANP
jgi:hypothetical protein